MIFAYVDPNIPFLYSLSSRCLLMPIASGKFDSLILIIGSTVTICMLAIPCSYLAFFPLALCLVFAFWSRR